MGKNKDQLTTPEVLYLFGRPTVFDQAKADAICHDVANGHSIVRACVNSGVERSTVYTWLTHKPHFKAAFTHARQLYGHSLADDCIEIAERCTQQDANAARVHIETKWRMAGRMNAVYNDKVVQELTGANGGPIATQIDATQLAALSLEQLRALSGVTSPEDGGTNQ